MKRRAVTVAIAALSFGSGFAAATPLSDLNFSGRAFQCESYEFAEIDSMSRDELQGAYCSYVIGSKRASKRNEETKEKYRDQPRILSALLGDHIQFLERCSQGMNKTSDLFSRKFHAPAPDCAAMAEKVDGIMEKRKNP
jgi:hypothetical protein